MILASLNRLYDLLVEAAVAGKPCPTNDELSCEIGGRRAERLIAMLEEDGKISRVMDGQYRVVTILSGPFAGAATGAPAQEVRTCAICGCALYRRPHGKFSQTCVSPSCRKELWRRTFGCPERTTEFHWPTTQPDALPQNCFAAHNLKFRPMPGVISRPESMTLGGVSAAWAVRGGVDG
jgi:hypothetical protein